MIIACLHLLLLHTFRPYRLGTGIASLWWWCERFSQRIQFYNILLHRSHGTRIKLRGRWKFSYQCWFVVRLQKARSDGSTFLFFAYRIYRHGGGGIRVVEMVVQHDHISPPGCGGIKFWMLLLQQMLFLLLRRQYPTWQNGCPILHIIVVAWANAFRHNDWLSYCSWSAGNSVFPMSHWLIFLTSSSQRLWGLWPHNTYYQTRTAHYPQHLVPNYSLCGGSAASPVLPVIFSVDVIPFFWFQKFLFLHNVFRWFTPEFIGLPSEFMYIFVYPSICLLFSLVVPLPLPCCLTLFLLMLSLSSDFGSLFFFFFIMCSAVLPPEILGLPLDYIHLFAYICLYIYYSPYFPCI